MKVVFMGTPDFAVNTLEKIIESGHEVLAVVTQPDKTKGRNRALSMPPVKETALKYNIPVYQPEKIRNSGEKEEILALNPDVIVVVAFGQILPNDILTAPRYGCVNVHASLLPKYRGAAPIQWAVINGDEYSGVTTMLMNDGVDTGDMLMVEKYRLADDETGGSLFDRLANMGAELLVRTLEGLEAGSITPKPQPEGASHAAKLTKETGLIDFNRPAEEIERLVRGLNPWPCAYTHYQGKTLKIWGAKVDNRYETSHEPGKVYKTDKDYIYVATQKGGIIITELQLEGKKRMTSEAFLRGCKIAEDTLFS